MHLAEGCLCSCLVMDILGKQLQVHTIIICANGCLNNKNNNVNFLIALNTSIKDRNIKNECIEESVCGRNFAKSCVAWEI